MLLILVIIMAAIGGSIAYHSSKGRLSTLRVLGSVFYVIAATAIIVPLMLFSHVGRF